jgi:hypothetical protein
MTETSGDISVQKSPNGYFHSMTTHRKIHPPYCEGWNNKIYVFK